MKSLEKAKTLLQIPPFMKEAVNEPTILSEDPVLSALLTSSIVFTEISRFVKHRVCLFIHYDF